MVSRKAEATNSASVQPQQKLSKSENWLGLCLNIAEVDPTKMYVYSEGDSYWVKQHPASPTTFSWSPLGFFSADFREASLCTFTFASSANMMTNTGVVPSFKRREGPKDWPEEHFFFQPNQASLRSLYHMCARMATSELQSLWLELCHREACAHVSRPVGRPCCIVLDS